MWTVETIAHLRRLIVDQGCSAVRAGQALGRTKGSIIGKCHREGIPMNPKQSMNAKRGRVAKPVKVVAPVRPTRTKPGRIMWLAGGSR